jgi:ABC-2 type transport system permease protein
VGSRIGVMGGFNYMQYIVPGLIMMAVITNSYSNVVSSFYSAKFQRSIEEMLVSPVPNSTILIGYVLGGVARGIAVGLIVTLLSLLFTHLAIHHVLVIIYTVMMTAVLFSLGGFINAVYAKSFDDISIVPTFVLTPLTYLGGVFYSIDLLPKFWQGVSLLNPIVYMVNAFRYGVLGVSDVNVWVALGMITAMSVGLFIFSLHLLNRGTGLRE